MERQTSAATCAEHRLSKPDARSSAADAATRRTAPTPKFRQLTSPSSDDVIINSKSFSAQGLSARKTGEANGLPNAANRVRPEGPFWPDGGTRRDVRGGSPGPRTNLVHARGRHGGIYRALPSRESLSEGIGRDCEGARDATVHPVRGCAGRGLGRRTPAVGARPSPAAASPIGRPPRSPGAVVVLLRASASDCELVLIGTAEPRRHGT